MHPLHCQSDITTEQSLQRNEEKHIREQHTVRDDWSSPVSACREDVITLLLLFLIVLLLSWNASKTLH